MSQTCVGSWHIRPTPAKYGGRANIAKTWTGPISGEMYGKGLKDLCNRTQENLTRLSLQMEKLDPCIEYGIKHWHPNSRPQSVHTRMVEKCKTPGRWESVEVMFTDSKALDSENNAALDTYVDPPVMNSFCYLCTTLEEHKRHMLQHRPKRRPNSARPWIEYIAPVPRQKRKIEAEKDINVRERLYKVEVFTSDKYNAGTNANVFIAIKGSLEMLPRTQLKKKRGCAKLCFMRASKEVFHIKGPFLGNLEILTVEHDGRARSHAWHLDHIEVTDIKILKTWMFHCEEWLSTFEKPHYSSILDLQASDKQFPVTDFTVEVHTGKQKMAGTDSNIFITLIGQLGSSKKVHLVDPSSDKKLFEKNSVDRFKIRIMGIGELKRIRIEHDGKGFAAGWFLNKIIILDSERPKDKFYFTYGGWIAKDEGDGKLWREIRAKKQLMTEIKSGTETKYNISVKTGDKRYAGTDANVFIQMAGVNGITPKHKLDDAKNNFERKMVDNFEVRSVNVGAMKHIVIGHDNFGPGAGWYLESVTVRRYIPKDEARDRLKTIKKRLKHEKKHRKDKEEDSDVDLNSESETDDKRDKKSSKQKDRKEKERHRDKKSKDSKRRRSKNLFSVSSSSESSSESSDEESLSEKRLKDSRRPSSALRRPTSAHRRDFSRDDSSDSSIPRRPGSALRRDRDKRKKDWDRHGKDDESGSRDRGSRDRGRERRSKSDHRDSRRRGSVDSDRSISITSSSSRSKRPVSTSASSLKRKSGRSGKGKSGLEADDDLDDLKVPLYEECFFECNKWLAAGEDDGLFVRELPVTKKTTFYKE